MCHQSSIYWHQTAANKRKIKAQFIDTRLSLTKVGFKPTIKRPQNNFEKLATWHHTVPTFDFLTNFTYIAKYVKVLFMLFMLILEGFVLIQLLGPATAIIHISF